MRIILIIPAYNEEKNIVKTCESIHKYNKNLDYIVINDCSTDDTAKICDKNKIPHIDLINNLGIGGAVQTGYLYAHKNDYDIAIQFDGDGQHNILDIDNLINPIQNGEADFCIGSRFITTGKGFKSTISRRFGIKIISFLIKLFTGKKISDPTSGYRAANKDIIKQLAYDYPVDYPEPESLVILIKNGYKVKEVPTQMNEREFGKSSISSLKSIYYMIKVSIAIMIRSTINWNRGGN